LILAQGAELYVESPEGTPPSNYCTWLDILKIKLL
jgi:hypothetical protein